jgi:galactokinase
MNRVVETHRTVFGTDPEGVWSAPGRVNLIGEHTDYNDGLVLPIALPHRTYAACSTRADDLLRVWSVQTDELVEVSVDDVGPGRPEGWAAYVAGVLWALREQGHEVAGLEVTVDSEVPVGAGLSSSAALECAVGAAASDLFHLGLLADDAGRARLAAACVRAENDVAGAPTGGMDQSASLLCTADHALLLDCRSGATEQVPFDLAGDGTAPGHVLLVTDTRAEHALNDGQYAERRTACEQAAAELGVASLRDVEPAGLDEALSRLSDDVLRRRARHVVTEIARVRATVEALHAGDLDEVGRLFDASHASLRDDYEVSCAELDVSVEAARGAGALGARMTGGGFGGSSIALLPEDAVDDARRAVADAFAGRGWREPQCFVVTAGAAAHRDS